MYQVQSTIPSNMV